MKFADVIGLDEVKQKLVMAVNNGRISHAMMFISSEGTGGLPLALAFAQYLNCTDRKKNDSCGTCPSCHKMEKLIHPDIHFSFPVIKKNDNPLSEDYIKEWRTALLENPYLGYYDWLGKMDVENKQANIAISECYNILKKMSFKTYEGNYKILIIWLPEYLGKNGNTLLKIIEEPPENTLFILVTQNKSLILNTILSRTQQILIPPFQIKSIAETLVSKFGTDEKEALKIAEFSSGNYSEALRILNSGITDYIEEFSKWMRLCLQNNTIGIYQWVTELTQEGREYQKNFLLYCIRFLREAVLLKNKASVLSHLKDTEKEFGEKFSAVLEPDVANKIYELLYKSHYHIERNANSKILFFNLSLSFNKIFRNIT